MSRRAVAGMYLITALATSTVTALALQLWSARLDVPFDYSGDALSTAAHIKTVLETGWYESQSLLGAPAGQVFHDFPTADNLHLIAARVIGVFTSDAAVAMNVYYLIGYPLAAISGLWFLRKVGVSPWIASALAVVFAIAPYHFQRSEGHLWLGSYYVVPLALGLVVMALRGERLWGATAGRRRGLGHLLGPTGRTVAIAAVTGTAQSYYAVFFLILLAFAGTVRLLATGGVRRFVGAGMTGLTTVGFMLANMLPDIIYSWIAGPNAGALGRSHAEAEIYGLKLVQLLLPWPGHRIPLLQSIRDRYDASYPLASERPALGLIAAVGFVLLIVIATYAVATWARPTRSSLLRARLGQLSGLVLLAFLCGTIGGLSSIVSFATTSLRGWNRISILIALLCLAAIGLVIDALVARRAGASTNRRTVLTVVSASLLVVVAFIDQTPGDLRGRYSTVAAKYQADEEFFAQVDQKLDPNSMVVQLPYLPFPEYITSTMVLSNDALIPYLHTHDIRWTGGGIKGRPTADWTGTLAAYPGLTAQLAAAAGADGILIDRLALPDSGAALMTELGTATGVPLLSQDGRWAFYDIHAVRQGLESPDDIVDRITNPVIVTPDISFPIALDENGTPIRVSAEWQSSLTLVSDDDATVRIELALSVPPEYTGTVESLTATLPDGRREVIPLTGGSAVWRQLIDVPAGGGKLLLEVTGSDPATTVIPIRISSYGIVDPIIIDALAG